MELNKWKNYIWNILERRMVIIMNLSELLENWDGNTQIVVKTDTEEVFCGKVADVSVDIACRDSEIIIRAIVQSTYLIIYQMMSI